MPEYLSPGVYVEEIDAGPKPITPVATSTAGFVGFTVRGPITPKLITSYGDFVRQYGGPSPTPDEATQSVWDDRGQYWRAAESVKAFFDEGGTRMYFQRVQPGGAVESSRQFHGGLFALLDGDIAVNSDKMRLSHVVGIAQGDSLAVISEDGTSIGTVTVGSVDYATRTLTLSAQAGFAARRGEALVTVLAVNTALNVLTVSAASAGEWGDDIAVRLLPVVTARLDLTSPAGGAPASTSTTTKADIGATSLTVNPIPGILDTATATPFSVRTRNKIMTVSAVAAAGAALNLTVAALSDAIPAGITVQKLRAAVNGMDIAVSGASRLYPKATVQLENSAGKAEVLRVSAVGDGSVTLSAAPTNTYVEGDALSLLEGELTVRYRPKDGGEEVERISGLRLIKDAHPNSIANRINSGSKLVRATLDADFDDADLQAFPAVDTGAWPKLEGGDDKIETLDVGDFVGENGGPGNRSGIQALEDIDEVAICVVPGMWSVDIRTALIMHCETLADRFAILDPPPKLDVQGVAGSSAARSTRSTPRSTTRG